MWIASQVQPEGCSGTTLDAICSFFNYTQGVKGF